MLRSLRLLVVLSSGVAACQPGFVEVPSLDDVNGPLAVWTFDDSNDVGSAYLVPAEAIGDGPAEDGEILSEVLYPEHDQDFWRVSVSEPNQLIGVALLYRKVGSTVSLAADWLGPRRLCVPAAPRACEASTACAAPTSFCDRERGGCRAASAPPCSDDSHCAAGETCAVGGVETLATLLEASGTSQHRISAILAAHQPGDYYLRVYDRSGTVSDPDTPYELQVGQLLDRDPFEGNGSPNQATPLGNGAPIEAALTFAGDVDWFAIDPAGDAGVTTPPVVSVELRWPRGVGIAPTWKLVQAGRELVSQRPVALEVDDNVSRATFVLPSSDPVQIQVVEPQNAVALHDNYSLSVRVDADADEGAARNDVARGATPLDATTLGGVHNATHTLIAENDADWYRLDRAANPGDNTLLYFRATASSSDIMLALLVYERVSGKSCDPNSQEICSGGETCVCPFSGSCAAGQGACIKPWVQRPLPNDPRYPPEYGGKTPNRIELHLPLFDGGPGALWLKVMHLQQVVPPRAGFSASDRYTLFVEHRAEPDAHDRSARKDEYFPLPLGVSEGSFESKKRPLSVGGLGATATGFISYEGDQDWFQFNAGGIGVGQAQVVFNQIGGGSLDLRVQVIRGGSQVGDHVNGLGMALDPSSECTHMYSSGDTILVWVNDNDFDDLDIGQPYAFTLDIVPGCGVPPCALCRCQPDQGCGCGNPAPVTCGTAPNTFQVCGECPET